MNKTEIPLSKTKILLLLMGSITFVILGLLFIITPETFTTTIFRNSKTIMFAGIAAILFFSMTSMFGIKKLFDQTTGLTIDKKGITDNSNASSVGLINWTDIKAIKATQVVSTKFLLIFVNNPEKYLERLSGWKRKLLESNMKTYGTPISITSNTLKYNFKDLEKLIMSKYNEKQGETPKR